jgi:hypothetical protein
MYRAVVMERQDTTRPAWPPLGRFDVLASVTGHARLWITEWPRHIANRIRGEAGALSIQKTVLTEVKTHLVREGIRHRPFPKPATVGILDKKKHLWIEVLEMLNNLPGSSYQGISEDEVPCPASVGLAIGLAGACSKENVKRIFALVVPR